MTASDFAARVRASVAEDGVRQQVRSAGVSPLRWRLQRPVDAKFPRVLPGQGAGAVANEPASSEAQPQNMQVWARFPSPMGSFTCHGHLDLTAPDEDGRIAELADATTAEDVYRAGGSYWPGAPVAGAWGQNASPQHRMKGRYL